MDMGWYLLLVLVGVLVSAIAYGARRFQPHGHVAPRPASPRPQVIPQSQPTPPHKAQPSGPQALVTAQWRDALNESPHLLIYGPSKAGKSTLAQAYVATFGGCEYVVIDPQPNKPGESKWGGIDFVTADHGDGDEWASVKAALKAVQEEDTRRRKALRHETFTPLIVIIDEVLALVDALGMVEDEQRKKEPVIAQFIRTMGYSARHRNIKIILIGQGKNLKDLGLDSGTARNNYALVRAARNAATNERAAYIVTDDGEVSMNLEHVLELEAAVNRRARLWLTQDDVAQNRTSTDVYHEPFLRTLNQYEPVRKSGTPDTDALDDDTLIRELVRRGKSANLIHEIVGGTRATVLEKVRNIKAEIDEAA